VSNIDQSRTPDSEIILPRRGGSPGKTKVPVAGDTSKHGVLVVDNEPGFRASMVELPNEEGYELSTAKNGFDALLYLQGLIPDIITCDLNIPFLLFSQDNITPKVSSESASAANM
jgi:Response regulator receiver domain